LVSNGGTLRHACRVGAGAKPVVYLLPFPTATDPAAPPEQVARARDEFLAQYGCPGVQPLLRNVRDRLQNPVHKATRWNGRDVVKVTGAWCADLSQTAAVPPDLLPRARPRRCQVYLDARTLWPHRIEWWGGGERQDRDALLM